MYLYHCITTYHLFCSLVDLIKKGQLNNSVLILYDFLLQNIKYKDLLDEFFSDVYVMPYNLDYNNISKSNNTIENVIFSKYKSSDFEEFHVMGAHFIFSQYLISNEINFIYYEEAVGMLSNSISLKEIVSKADKNQHKFALENGLYDGNNEYIEKIFCNFNAQAESFYNEKVEHFDVVDEFLKLTKDNQKKIINFFVDYDEIDIEKEAVLFLTQHFANLNVLTFEGQISIYQLVIDYFLENEIIVFKTHPNDITYYKKIFPKAKVIRDKFPSELLPTIFKNKPKEIVTITSTGIKNLSPYFNSYFDFDRSFEKKFDFIHRYYIALKYINEIQFANLYYLGSNPKLVENFSTHSDINFDNIKPTLKLEIKENTAYLIDDISRDGVVGFLDKLPATSTAVFINSENNFIFYEYYYKYLWEDITPILITKSVHCDTENYHSLEDDKIYVYSKNKENLHMANNLNIDKKLESSGITIKAEELQGDKLQIKVLEGILEATEKRLLHYIESANNKGDK